MARVALPASKIKARRRRRRVIAISAAVLFLLILLGGFVWFMHAPFLKISKVDVSGTQTLATSTVAEYVQHKIEGEYVYLFPKNNILFYPKGRIASGLLKDMPVISSITISAKDFKTISVTVIERQPKALWCGTMPTSPVPCFLLDESGVAYGASAGFSGNVYTKYFGALLGSTTPKQYLHTDEFHSLSALVDTIAANQKSQSLLSVWVDENKDVHLIFASGFTLLFTLSVDGADVFQRFTLALQSEPFKTHSLSDFEYLDLRFGDKLYYKLK